MPAKQNLIGQKFSRLIVIDEAPSRNKKTYWKCQCDCGNIIEARADALKNKKIQSCGCLNTEKRSALGKSHLQDIQNQTFGHLKTIKRLNYRKNSSVGYSWECLCDCGNIIEVPINDLKSGNTTSCGCIKQSDGEKNIGILLMKLKIPFETQKEFFDLYNFNNSRKLKFDFFIPNENILIEFDGPQHYKNTNFTSENNLINDQIKNKWALQNNIKLYRVPYTEKNNILNYKTISELCKKEFLVQKIDHYSLGEKIASK